MKKLFILVLLLLAPMAQAVDWVRATLTVTNAANVFNGTNYVVNGTTRSATNTASSGAWFLTNSANNALATNIYLQIGLAQIPLITARMTSTNAVQFEGQPGSAMTLTAVGTWASVSYQTQVVVQMTAVRVPIGGERYETNRTNIASQLTQDLNDYSTNPFATNAHLLANFVSAGVPWGGGVQSVFGPKKFYGFSGTNNGNIWGGTFSSNILDRDEAFFVKIFGDTYYSAAIQSGLWFSDNGTTWGGHIKADQFGFPGIYTRSISTNGGLDAIQEQGIDAINNGPWIALNVIMSEQMFPLLLSDYSGPAGPTDNMNHWTRGNFWTGSYSNIFLTPVYFSGPVWITNLFVDGPGNRIANTALISTTPTNTTFKGTNVWVGDISYTPRLSPTLANGNNSGIILSSNVDIELSGATTIATICGFVAERLGATHEIRLSGAATNIISNMDGNEAAPANRIWTGTGGPVAFTNQPAWIKVRYNTAGPYWELKLAR